MMYNLETTIKKYDKFQRRKMGNWSKEKREKSFAARTYLTSLKYGINRMVEVCDAVENFNSNSEELMYLTIGFYYIAFRFTKIFEELTGYKKTNFKGIHKTRNMIFEHYDSQKKNLRTPTPSFGLGFTPSGGPQIVPIAIGRIDYLEPDMRKHYHFGVYKDAEEFIKKLERRLDTEISHR